MQNSKNRDPTGLRFFEPILLYNKNCATIKKHNHIIFIKYVIAITLFAEIM